MMSFLELLKDEPLILISLVVTVLPMLVAIILLASVNLRQRLQRRAMSLAEVKYIEDQVSNDASTDFIIEAMDVEPTEDSQQDEESLTLDDEDEEDDDTENEEADEEETDDGMNDILSSVFTEEVDTSHFDVLLEGREPIEIEELAQSVRDMHHRLTGKGAA
jgi:hypothetical protein